ncbi:hypothetical protein COOONC_16155 [Cooperia oncophora]
MKETMKTDVPLSKLPIKIRIALCCLDGYRKGTALYGQEFERNPFLCSRPAGVFQKGVERYATTVRQLGYPLEFGRDPYGDPRPFAVLPVEYPHEGLRLKSNLRTLHQMCNVFLNGYIASRFDFYDGKEYRRVLSKVSSVFCCSFQKYRSGLRLGATLALKNTSMESVPQERRRSEYNGNTMGQVMEHWKFLLLTGHLMPNTPPHTSRKRRRLTNSVLMTKDGYVQVDQNRDQADRGPVF